MQQNRVARLWRMWDHSVTDSNKMADWAQGYQLTNLKETPKDVKIYAPQARSTCWVFQKHTIVKYL